MRENICEEIAIFYCQLFHVKFSCFILTWNRIKIEMEYILYIRMHICTYVYADFIRWKLLISRHFHQGRNQLRIYLEILSLKLNSRIKKHVTFRKWMQSREPRYKPRSCTWTSVTNAVNNFEETNAAYVTSGIGFTRKGYYYFFYFITFIV